jgi:predicted nuclease of predicted toxin-antitoxin system
MKFVVDAHLPRRLAQHLVSAGQEAFHTFDLPDRNCTRDSTLASFADEIGAAVVTKDGDFVISRTLRGSPVRLVFVVTGNIDNNSLIELFMGNLSVIVEALQNPARIELGRSFLVTHP